MNATIYVGDCLEWLRDMPSGSVHTCVTSPPYFGLRDYGHEGQLGLEPTPAEFVARLVGVFAEVWRVLRDDGTLWLNLGDTYASTSKGSGGSSADTSPLQAGWRGPYRQAFDPRKVDCGIPEKNLVGIPWRVAFALQDAGWYLRSDIIWSKGNPMPESVTDRPTRSHEYLFLLTKRPRYFYDHEAVKEASVADDPEHAHHYAREYEAHTQRHEDRARPTGQPGNVNNTGIHSRPGTPGKRNRRSVWNINTRPFPGAHFAVFPPDLIEPCILAGTSARGCCPECGAPWQRVTERVKDWRDSHHESAQSYQAGSGNRTARSHSGAMSQNVERTTGWEPTCDCCQDGLHCCVPCSRVDRTDTLVSGCPGCGLTMIPAPYEPVPCVVLDPFGGSGTSAMVALQHGRHAVLCELNPAYADMAAARIVAPAPLLISVTLVNRPTAPASP